MVSPVSNKVDGRVDLFEDYERGNSSSQARNEKPVKSTLATEGTKAGDMAAPKFSASAAVEDITTAVLPPRLMGRPSQPTA
ncbi:hypothetical protein RSAG8_10735, partial [Rhizoctonia solani AG-8 WAC10335]